MLHPIRHMYTYPHSIYTHSLPSINHTHPKHTYTYFNAHMYHQTQSQTHYIHTPNSSAYLSSHPFTLSPSRAYACIHEYTHSLCTHVLTYTYTIHIYTNHTYAWLTCSMKMKENITPSKTIVKKFMNKPKKRCTLRNIHCSIYWEIFWNLRLL